MSNTFVVTTCSLNHLAQAKGLGDSLIQHNPGYKLVIGLVDNLNGRIPESYYSPHILVEAEDVNIPDFLAMQKRYNVFELNCALKTFFVDYVFRKLHAERVIFLDSDILVFDSLQYLEDSLEEHPVLLTPHILSSYPIDSKRPLEREMLKNGIFNGGFFAIKNNREGLAFLKWWMERMVNQCYVNLKEGMFVDQKWLNLASLFFSYLKCLSHPGCNMAYWNLHERKLTGSNGDFKVNDQPLLFYHFSGYSLQNPALISKHQDRYSMIDNASLKELFSIYDLILRKNNHEGLKNMPCYYEKKKGILQKLKIKN